MTDNTTFNAMAMKSQQVIISRDFTHTAVSGSGSQSTKNQVKPIPQDLPEIDDDEIFRVLREYPHKHMQIFKKSVVRIPCLHNI